jgi:hypothetical protein
MFGQMMSPDLPNQMYAEPEAPRTTSRSVRKRPFLHGHLRERVSS